MPELPEVETVRRGLSKLIIGQKIIDVQFDWPKGFPNSTGDVKNFLIGAKILSVKRRAKVLIIDLDSKYSLVVHLKMTGQLVYRSNDSKTRYGAGHPNDSLIGKLPDKSTRVTIGFKDSKLFFNDQRKFGWMRLLPTIEVPNIDFFKKVGPEPLEDVFKFPQFKIRLLKRKNSNIKSVILDQSIIAGVGNIYADESLFAAKIHPKTIVGDISEAKLRKLYTELRRIMKLSIELGGSTDRNYVDAEGKKGSYLKFALVFRRDGQPCVKCGTIIQKLKVAGRGTHVCPSCQKIEES